MAPFPTYVSERPAAAPERQRPTAPERRAMAAPPRAVPSDVLVMPPIPQALPGAGVADAVAAALQRAAEVILAATALVVTSPIMLLVAIIIRLDSPGPVMFRQTRVGAGGRLFTFYKFRTLYADARQRFPELYAYAYSPHEIQTLKFKREQDPRVTRAGRWLRRSTLDELPNFWNLLKGDIAVVGPRPEIPEMVKHYAPEQLAKFSVRPGITGLAQTHGRGNLSFQDTIAWDVEYVRTKSVWLDLRIILRTLKMVIRLDGAF